MKILDAILGRLGYVKMERFGLTMTAGSLFDSRGRNLASGFATPLPFGIVTVANDSNAEWRHKLDEATAQARRDEAEEREWERSLVAARTRVELLRTGPTAAPPPMPSKPPHTDGAKTRTGSVRASRTTGALAPQFERVRSNLAR